MAMVASAHESEAKLKVLLADDHVRVLATVEDMLRTDFRIVAAVTDGRSALEAAKKLNPDVVVLDITMPGLDGLKAAQQLRRLGSTAKIVFLTVHEDEAYIAAARTCGDGYVLKSRLHSDLRVAIDEAIAGRFFVSRRTAEHDKN
jgi:DNA-binding NarL/FixJ family response regulator